MEKLNNKFKYIIASILMMLFVLNDLLFDFIFNFKTSDFIAFGFTLFASIITFIGTFDLQKQKIINTTDKVTIFIKSNFNKWQVIFSILDIICGIISILSGVVFIGGLFKIIKLCYIPTKCLVVVNKGKTLIKGAAKGSLLWTASRMLLGNYGGNKMFTWIKNNKLTLAYCVVLGCLSGYVGYSYTANIGLPLFASILIGFGAIVVTCLLSILLGGDKIKSAVFRGLSRTLNNENYEKVVELANTLLDKQDIEETAKAELEAEKKAKALEEKKQAKAVKTEEEIKAEQEKAQLEAERRKLIDEAKAKLVSQNMEVK